MPGWLIGLTQRSGYMGNVKSMARCWHIVGFRRYFNLRGRGIDVAVGGEAANESKLSFSVSHRS